MLRITLHDSAEYTRIKLEGKLAGPWVRELDQCWTTAASALNGRAMVLDLDAVSFVDEAGVDLLTRMHRQRVRLVASGPLIRSIVEKIAVGQKPIVALLVLFCLCLPVCMQAQAPAPLTPSQQAGAAAPGPAGTPLRLSLGDAVQLALRQNPQVQIANITRAQTEQDVRIARSGLLPQAGVQVTEDVRRANLEANFGQPFPGVPHHIGPFEVFQAGTAFSAPILDLTLWRRWQASKQVVRAAGAQENSVREQTALLIVSQYLDGLRATADVHAAQSRVDLAQALYTQAADLQRAGVGTGIDTLRANVELQNERQRLITSRMQLETSLFGLSRLLNLPPAQRVELADEVSFFETPAIQVDQSLEAAFQNRPEIRALLAQQEAARIQRQGARDARLPSLRFNGSWAQQGLTPSSVIPAYNLGFALEFPLFTGGRIGAETARADLEIRRLEQQTADTRSQIALEVKTAAAQLEAARSEVDVANQGVKLAAEEVTQARDRFEAGVANNIEVISAQDALARANDNQIVALYRYNQARADLARATGQVQSIYAK
jgi:outer membrane protein TolC/anti-anti-sigma regulatory factor